VNAYWNRWPGANIGVPTGERSGVWVLDVDRPGALEELGHELPPTRTVRTPRGGIHLYFRHVEGVTNSPGGLPEGIDVRGEGGYVLVPPSDKYAVENRAEVAEAPEWLLELVRERRPSRSRDARGAGQGVEGEAIPEGTRNTTLFFIALSLKDSGKSREEVLDELLATNEGRCSPPVDDDEVEEIARSACRYPVRSGSPPPEVVEAVEQLEEFWWANPWSGMGGKTDRDVYRVLVELARRYGRILEDGSVAVSGGVRSVALAAATTFVTVSRGATKRLARAGLIRKSGGGRKIDEAATWELLPPPRQVVNTQHPGTSSEAMLCVNDLSRQRLWDLRTPAFRWTGHVKKGRAGVLYVLETHGPMRLEALAELMGWSRVRDLRARYVDPLIALGLVEEREGLLALPEDHAERVEEIRRTPCTTVRRRRRRSVDPATGREVRWVEEVEYTASEVEREEKDRRDHKDHQKGWRLHLAKESPEADDRCREVLNTRDEERESAGGTVEYDGMVVDRETGEVLEDDIIRSEAEVFELARAWFGKEAA
jgi:hypothetical protein